MTPPKKIYLDLSGASEMSNTDCALAFLGKHALSPHDYISVEWLKEWIEKQPFYMNVNGSEIILKDELLTAIEEP